MRALPGLALAGLALAGLRLAGILALVLLAAPAASAQSDLVQAIREATARLDYAAAEARAREALARVETLSPDEAVEAHAALGVVLHARGADVEAREQFRAALSLDPSLALDPVLVSPRTIELLETLRAEAPAAVPGAAAVRYLVLRDPRPGAAWRSALLPGWGQFHKGHRRRGLAFAVGVGTATVATGAAHLAYRDAHAAYLAAPTPLDAAAAYGPMNRAFRRRNALAAVAAAGWALGVVEALATGAPRAPAAAQSVGPSAEGVALRVRF